MQPSSQRPKAGLLRLPSLASRCHVGQCCHLPPPAESHRVRPDADRAWRPCRTPRPCSWTAR
jgi:hypothetical protein